MGVAVLIDPLVGRGKAVLQRASRQDKKRGPQPLESGRTAFVCGNIAHDGSPQFSKHVSGHCGVGLYEDRLEVTSPGGLHNSMTVKKMIASRRYARNNILVLMEIMRDYGYVDHRGMGGQKQGSDLAEKRISTPNRPLKRTKII